MHINQLFTKGEEQHKLASIKVKAGSFATPSEFHLEIISITGHCFWIFNVSRRTIFERLVNI